MEEYFARQIKLWGREVQLELQKKHIVIVGCGGLGCSLGVALGSSGIGKITLIDFDRVGIHNIHRQIGFKVGDEGRAKCVVLKELLESRSPYVEIVAFDGSLEGFIAKGECDCDLILDATDNLPSRAMIDNFAKSKNTPWVYGSVEEFHGQVCFFHKASFVSVFGIKERVPNGIACPIVLHIASIQANLALKYLANFDVKKDLLYYLFFNDEGEYIVQKFGLPQ